MWKLNANERLNRWREFRKQIAELPFEERLIPIVDFWLSCPFIPYYLDPTLPDSWPDPWVLIEENCYCDLAKCLGIVYTLYLTSHQPQLEIRQYNDKEANILYNLVWVDQGKYVLNLEHDSVVNKKHIQSSFRLQKKITITDLKLEQIQ